VSQRAQECLLLKSRVSDLCDSSSKEAYTEHNCFTINSVSVTQVGHLNSVVRNMLSWSNNKHSVLDQFLINLFASATYCCVLQ
jgi:hypothetical protein